MPDFRADLTGYLFGDVLSVSTADLLFSGAGGLICGVLLAKNWKNQVFCAVAPDIAQSEGVNTTVQNRLFTMITALFVAVAFKTTGILLVSALLVIPACAARFVSRTPEQMAVSASVVGVLCCVVGIFCSAAFDAPAAPAIELACVAVFVFCGLKAKKS